MILTCRKCGRLNSGEWTSIDDCKCHKCNSQIMDKSEKIVMVCKNCNLGQKVDLFGWKESTCRSCGKEIKNPLYEVVWGKTHNKGHDFVKFSMNLRKEEMEFLDSLSNEIGVQKGAILRMLLRKQGGLICG